MNTFRLSSTPQHQLAQLVLVACLACLAGGALIPILGPVVLLAPVAAALCMAMFFDERVALGAAMILVAVVGSEVKLGPVLLVDAAVLVGLAGVFARYRLSLAPTENFLPVLLLGLSVLVALFDATESHLILTDLHGVALMFAIYPIAWRAIIRLGDSGTLVLILAVTFLAAAKALMVAALASYVPIGAESVWQAYVINDEVGIKRVVLVGGDTFLALGPALAVMARRIPLFRNGRWILLFLVAALATAATGTRTNIVAGSVALALALMLDRLSSSGPVRARGLILEASAAAALLVVLALTLNVGGQGLAQNVTQRFDAQSNIQQSVRYREVESDKLGNALDQSPVVGLGAGGTFISQVASADGREFVAGPTLWAHNGFLWIMLKVGFVGIVLFSIAVWLVMRTLWRSRAQVLARAAMVWLIGILILSISTNRFNDAGAGILIAMAFAVARTRVAASTVRQVEPVGPVRTASA